MMCLLIMKYAEYGRVYLTEGDMLFICHGGKVSAAVRLFVHITKDFCGKQMNSSIQVHFSLILEHLAAKVSKYWD